MRFLEPEEIHLSCFPLLWPRCSAAALLTVLVRLVNSLLMSDNSFDSVRAWNLPPMVASKLVSIQVRRVVPQLLLLLLESC